MIVKIIKERTGKVKTILHKFAKVRLQDSFCPNATGRQNCQGMPNIAPDPSALANPNLFMLTATRTAKQQSACFGSGQALIQHIIHRLGDRHGNALLLGKMMGKKINDYDELTEIENSAIIEIGNILISSFINALSGLSGVRITPSVPQISIDMQGAIITVPMAAYGSQSDYIMLIGGSFLVEHKEVPCRLLLAPDMRSLNYLLHRLGILE